MENIKEIYIKSRTYYLFDDMINITNFDPNLLKINTYLILDSTDKNKEILKMYTELWDGIKNLIEKINNKLGKYEKGFMKIKSNSDDNLPLNKTLKLHNMTIIIRFVFEENSKYYPQGFFDECLREL